MSPAAVVPNRKVLLRSEKLLTVKVEEFQSRAELSAKTTAELPLRLKVELELRSTVPIVSITVIVLSQPFSIAKYDSVNEHQLSDHHRRRRDNTIIDDLRWLSRTYKNPWDEDPVETICLHTYASIADYALDDYHDPDLYFADISVINNKIIWKTPSYAIYGRLTKLVFPAGYTPEVHPSSHIELLDKEEYHFFIERYLKAWKEIHFWQFKVQNEDWGVQRGAIEKALVQKSVDHWIASVNALIINPYLDDGWPTPAFYQWYIADLKTMSAYFVSRVQINEKVWCGCYRGHQINTKSFDSRVSTEIDAWEQCAESVFLPNGAPFVKCLWMHTAIADHECYFTSDECTEAGKIYYRNLQTQITSAML